MPGLRSLTLGLVVDVGRLDLCLVSGGGHAVELCRALKGVLMPVLEGVEDVELWFRLGERGVRRWSLRWRFW